MWTVLILTVVIVSVFCFTVVQYFEIKKKMAASNLEKEAVLEKYAPIMDIEAESKDLQRQLDELRQNFENSTASLKLNYKEKKAIYDSLQSKIRLLQDDEEMFEVGIYHPQFDIEDGDKFKQAIKANREKQKESVRNKEACTCSTEWEVGGSKREGKKMTDQKIRLMLRAFNGECDAAISKVNWRNASTMEARIEKAYESINKQGESSSTSLAHSYLLLKLEELHLTHEKNIKIQEEKEEQQEIRAQMREEARIQKEYEKAERDAAKEEEGYQKALLQARAELAAASSEEQEILNEKLLKLEADLAEAHSKTERIVSQAQLTRRGHVYVISNMGSFGDDVFKIGMTRRLEPYDRVKELGDASVPFRFDVHAMIFSDDAPSLESTLHKKFKEKRVNQINHRKEFFRVNLTDVEKAVTDLGLKIEFTKKAEAQEYRESLAIEADKSKTHSQPATMIDQMPQQL
jgi:hypothetical protein